MLRVFPITFVLMCSLLLMIAPTIGHARQNSNDALRWLVMCCEINSNLEKALYLDEPYSGRTERLTPFFDEVKWLAERDGWFYFSGRSWDEDLPSIYRVQQGGEAEFLVGRAHTFARGFSPDGRWLVFSRPDESGADQWYSISTEGGSEIGLTEGLKLLNATLQDFYFEPIFSPDGEWAIFQGGDHQGLAVFRARLDGGGLENLTQDIGQAEVLRWLPEPLGLIIHLLPTYGDVSKLYSLNPDSHQIRLLATAQQPVTSERVWWLGPDKLGFVGGINLVQVARTTDAAILWEEANINNFWASPNGNWSLALKNDGQMLIRRGDGSSRQILTPPFDMLFLENLWWAQDGESAYFYREYNLGTSEGEIWQIDMATGQFTNAFNLEAPIQSVFPSPDSTHWVIRTYSALGVQEFIAHQDGTHKAELPFDQRFEGDGFVGWGPIIDPP